MQPDDGDDTVVRARPGAVPGGPDPIDLESDTVIGPVIGPDGEPDAAPVEPPVLVGPPVGHPPVVERPGVAREDSPEGRALVAEPDATPWRRIRVNRHEPIPLDAPVLIGRSPVPPRIALGRAPRLVRVPSPGREVSGTHVELRQQGASVVVTDVHSTNGTIVVIPGSSARKLRQGESLVVSTGTVVDIGDGNTVEILPVERVV
jgi:hypothetical protein